MNEWKEAGTEGVNNKEFADGDYSHQCRNANKISLNRVVFKMHPSNHLGTEFQQGDWKLVISLTQKHKLTSTTNTNLARPAQNIIATLIVMIIKA